MAPSGSRLIPSGMMWCMYTDDDYMRLASAASRRRDELDLTQMEVAQAGGLSLDRVSAVERGEARNLRGKTIRSLERGLRWQSGSVKGVLDGMADGVPIEEAPARGRRSAMDEAEVLMDENERMIAEITESVREFDANTNRTIADLIRMLKRSAEERSQNDH